MKKIAMLLSILVFITGCSVIRVDNQELSDIIPTVLKEKSSLYNEAFEGYKYYVPKGMKIKEKHDYNQVLEGSGNKYYLYIDVISYYYNSKINYDIDNSKYLSMELKDDKKEGYIEIEEKDNEEYFVKCVYNYGKIEVYTKKENLNETVVNTITILKSISYNKKIINSFVGENKLNFTEESFSLFKNDKKKDDNFLEYIEEYDKYYDVEGELPEDSQIDIDSSKNQ